MSSKEKGHERIPHAHIRKGRYLKHEPYKNTVRVNLNDLSVMDNAEKKAINLFGKEKWAFVMSVLKKNQDLLIKNYNDMQKGALIESISLNLDEETYQSIPNIFKY